MLKAATEAANSTVSTSAKRKDPRRYLEHIVDGNTDYKNGLKIVKKGLVHGERVTFNFYGGCDDRCYPALAVIRELDSLKADYIMDCNITDLDKDLDSIVVGRAYLTHVSRNDDSPCHTECYSLVGINKKIEGRRNIHPQEIERILVFKPLDYIVEFE